VAAFKNLVIFGTIFLETFLVSDPQAASNASNPLAEAEARAGSFPF
jgi:hypothetical protein